MTICDLKMMFSDYIVKCGPGGSQLISVPIILELNELIVDAVNLVMIGQSVHLILCFLYERSAY